LPWIRPPTGTRGCTWPRSCPYDAAVIDIMLPGLDGLSLIERLRAQKINLPVIILSASDPLTTGSEGFRPAATTT